MNRHFLLALLLVVVAAVVIQAAVIPSSGPLERQTMKLLGTRKVPRTVTKFGVTSVIYENWRYWYSVNSAGWSDAKKDCEANGDTLLYLETNEEVENVTRWLESTDDSGSSYWVGGKWDVRTSSFIWDNGSPINPAAPWGAGQPTEQKPTTRVAADTVGRLIELKTQAATYSTRYICEGEAADDGEKEKIPQPCYKDNELVIVVDSSGSIDDDHYFIAKEFTARLATTWVDHPGSRVSVLIFSNKAQLIFGLTDDQKIATMRDKIYGMPHIKSDTRSNLGLQMAIDEIVNNNRDVLQNIVFVTDGATNPPSLKPDTAAQAERAKHLGIRTFSVGIGTSIDRDELLVIAGGNPEHIFTTNEFTELLGLLRPLSVSVCEG